MLASFRTVTDAVLYASAIQKACMNIPDLKLRIGIHQGEVVFEDNDVFGDGVNGNALANLQLMNLCSDARRQ